MRGLGVAEDQVGVECFIPRHLSGHHWASSPQVNHLRCLHEFVESQTTYYAQCYRHMLDLQKQLGRCPLGSPGSQAHCAARPSPGKNLLPNSESPAHGRVRGQPTGTGPAWNPPCWAVTPLSG